MALYHEHQGEVVSFDNYGARLKNAMWDWMESKLGRFYKAPRNKDRVSGRKEKRGARQEVRKEIEGDK